MAANENQGKNNPRSRVMYGLKPFVGFAICLASAFFKTGTKVAVKHLNSVSPVLISCIQYLVIGLLAQPVAACRSNIESPFPKGRCYVSTLLIQCTVHQPLEKKYNFGKSCWLPQKGILFFKRNGSKGICLLGIQIRKSKIRIGYEQKSAS